MTTEHEINADARRDALLQWLGAHYSDAVSLRPVATDAGARRYFRFNDNGNTLIAADAPPESEDNAEFLAVSKELLDAGIRVPAQYRADLEMGFLVMEDLGDHLFGHAIAAETPEPWYDRAIDLLAKIHSLSPATRPQYDRALVVRELSQFTDHYLPAFGAQFSDAERVRWRGLCDWLSEGFCELEPVWTHRDYHCRNLFALPNGTVGVIDYQGALAAPPGYDLASLLRDCYVDVPQSLFERSVSRYADARGLADTHSLTRNIDLLGMQRHIKCLGAFVRFDRQLGKPQYLQALPQVADYLRSVAERYTEAQFLPELLARYPVRALL
ncbi:MAG: phosphotransferase [Pseudomonadota bacterium]